MSSKNLFLAFLVGFTAGMGTMFYIGSAFHHSKHPDVEKIHPEFLLLLAPITLGIANMLNVYTRNRFSFFIGILVALGFSSYGIGLDLPKTIFNTTPEKARLVALVYYTWLFWSITKINQSL